MNDKLQGEPTYAFRRLGLEDFCTCTKERFDELSDMPDLFEMRIFYDAPPSTAQAVEAAIRKAAEVCERKQKHYERLLENAESEEAETAWKADAWTCMTLAAEIRALIPTEAAQVERDAKDAEALRLAVKHGLRVECKPDGQAYVWLGDDLIWNEFALHENSDGERLAATCRAIVRDARSIEFASANREG